MTMTLTIGTKSFPVADYAEASSRYEQFRGAKPASRMPEAFLADASGERVGYVSYNARVWTKWNGELLFCPRGEHQA